MGERILSTGYGYGEMNYYYNRVYNLFPWEFEISKRLKKKVKKVMINMRREIY